MPDKSSGQVGDTEVVVELTLKSGLANEPARLVVVTADGESKPHDLLVDGAVPVIKEHEPNDGFRAAQEVKLPVIVEAVLDKPKDVDTFKFAGRAGQHVILEIMGARHGSPIDSVLTLYNGAGLQVATNDDSAGSTDSRIALALPADDTYYAVVMDAHDTGSALHIYRLLIK